MGTFHCGASAWIRVQDRLPDDDLVKFLVITKFGYIIIAQRRYGNKEWLVGGMRISGDITHWMPLPEPPKPTKEQEHD